MPNTTFVEQLESHVGVLQAYCRRLTGNDRDGEDLYQITLEKAYRVYREKPGINRAYLLRIARNAWIDHHRKKSVYEVPLMGEHAVPETKNDVNVREAFEVMAERLSIRQSILLLMIDVFGFTAKETAAQLDSTEGAVKEALKRTRLRLARYDLEMKGDTRQKADLSSSVGGTPREMMEIFIHAFRCGSIQQILTSYRQLRNRGIDVAKVCMQKEYIYFDFLDPNGHLMRIYSEKF